MPKKNKNEQPEKNSASTGWRFILQTFITSLASKVGDNINEKKVILINNLKKLVLGSFLATVGFIFVLIAAIILINSMLGNRWPWAGWGAVGAVVLAFGYFTAKKRS